MKELRRHGEAFVRAVRRAPPPSALAEIITDQSVRSMYARLVTALESLPGLRVVEGRVDLRAEVGEQLLCRVVPYRELLHIRVGADPGWEVRVRDRSAYVEAVDRILREFCRIASRRTGGPGPSAPV